MYITLNSQFRPFTYDELVKPLSDYTEAYNKVEEQYNTLAQQTEAWKNIATQENSPEAYAMYKKYSDELNAAVEDFSRGMTIKNRSQLAGLKSRYASDITPISIAYDAFQKANAYRDTIKEKDNSAIFNVDRYTSLDDFLNGQMADNNFISGKNLQSRMSDLVKGELSSTYNYLINKGMAPETAVGNVLNAKNINNYASSIKEEIGYDNFDDESKSKIDNYLALGATQGWNSFYSKASSKVNDKNKQTTWKDLVEDYEANKKYNEIIKQEQQESKGDWYGNKGKVGYKDLDSLYPDITYTDTTGDSETTVDPLNIGSSKGNRKSIFNKITDQSKSSKSTNYKQSAKLIQSTSTIQELTSKYKDEIKDVIKYYAENNGLTEEEATKEFENSEFSNSTVSYRVYTSPEGKNHLYLQLPSREDLTTKDPVKDMIKKNN